jgi:hypothetical protein
MIGARMRIVVLASVLASVVLAIAPRDVGADVAAAARAFSDGQAAQLEGDYDRAAQSFELAFAIAPSKEALRSAVRARQHVKQLARAATLAELLLAQYAADPASVRLALDVIAEAKPKLGRMAITCAASCTVAVGGRAISVKAAESHVVYVIPGSQALEITFDGGQPVTRELVVAAGDDIKVPVERPAVEAPPAAPARPTPPPEAAVEPPRLVAPPPPVVAREPRGLSPLVAITGAVVTVGLAGTGVWSGLDTNHAHDAYAADPTSRGWSEGRSKQLRTNVLFAGAAAAGITTALVAVFWTRWHGEESSAPVVGITSSAGNGVVVTWGSTF